MEQWITYKLGKIAECSLGKMLDQRKNKGKPQMYLGNIAVRWGSFNINPSQTMLFEDHELTKYKLEINDIVICEGGEPGRCAMWKSKDTIYIQKALHRVRVNRNIADPFYVYYYITYLVKSHLLDSYFTGTTIKHLPREQLLSIDIKIPNLATQKKIGNILENIDSKIDLNRRINDNLEQQAQALFKSWFVEKPNPQWTKGSLSDIASFVGGYSYKGDELVDSSNTGMATIKNYNRSGGFKTDGFKAINPSDKVKNAQYAELFEILVAHTDLTQNAEVIGNAELVLSLGEYNKIIFSMDLVKVLPSSSFPYRFLIAAMLKNKLFKGHCQGYVNGTTVLHLNKKALPEYKVMIPTDTEAKKMNEILGGYYKRMSENLKENDMLEQLRDTILPKLMSGELKINDLNC